MGMIPCGSVSQTEPAQDIEPGVWRCNETNTRSTWNCHERRQAPGPVATQATTGFASGRLRGPCPQLCERCASSRHPLNRRSPLKAVGRFFAWQIATRLGPGAFVVPYVGETRLLVTRGMTGATGNVYCGLHEFEDMAFVLHALRPEDLFVDVGANVGSYTILASGAAGARCISFEPAPSAYRALLDNIRLNDLLYRVEARNECLAAAPGEVQLTSGLDTVNHVVMHPQNGVDTVRVAVTTLDAALAGRAPAIIKIDVEGYETAVIDGADETLRAGSLRAVLMELNGSGARYG